MGRRNGQKVKLVGRDKDSLIKQTVDFPELTSFVDFAKLVNFAYLAKLTEKRVTSWRSSNCQTREDSNSQKRKKKKKHSCHLANSPL